MDLITFANNDNNILLLSKLTGRNLVTCEIKKCKPMENIA